LPDGYSSTLCVIGIEFGAPSMDRKQNFGAPTTIRANIGHAHSTNELARTRYFRSKTQLFIANFSGCKIKWGTGGIHGRGGAEISETPLQHAPTSITLSLQMSSVECAIFGRKRNFGEFRRILKWSQFVQKNFLGNKIFSDGRGGGPPQTGKVRLKSDDYFLGNRGSNLEIRPLKKFFGGNGGAGWGSPATDLGAKYSLKGKTFLDHPLYFFGGI